jgi:D-sedoheptulose 7-phosphate isomerase
MKTFYERYPELEGQRENIEKAIDILEHCFKNNGKILVCGNGGSSADSAHIVGELMKSFMAKRPLNDEISRKINQEFGDEVADKLQLGIPCIDLTAQSALLTAFSNDADPAYIFAQQVVGYSRNNPNDVVLGISTSGNSKNVVNAIRVAKSLGLKTIALTGKEESALSKLSTVCVRAPEKETFKVQEYHLPIYHYICMELEKRI